MLKNTMFLLAVFIFSTPSLSSKRIHPPGDSKLIRCGDVPLSQEVDDS